MTNYEKILADLQNMSIEDFAKTRIAYCDAWGTFHGDFGAADEHDTALKLEVEWLKKEVKNENLRRNE